MPLEFPNGELHLPVLPFSAGVEGAQRWVFTPWGTVVSLVCIVLVLLSIRPLVRIWPMVIRGAAYARTNIEVGRNLSIRRSQDLSLALLAPSTITLLYLYGVFGITVWKTILFIAGYFILRNIVYTILRHRKISYDDWSGVGHSLVAGGIFLSVLVILSFVLSYIFGIGGNALGTIFRVELILVASIHLKNIFEIVKLYYTPFRTFLYLCALEILPLASCIAAFVLSRI